METLTDLINKSNLKALLIGRLNNIIAGVSAASIIVLISCWGAAIGYEKSGIARRYGASFLGLILQIASFSLILVSQRVAPNLLLYYLQELTTVLALIVTGVAMGMNDVVVNVCSNGNASGKRILCGAHYVELLAYFVVTICLMITYAASQQRVITFVDKGVLDGIKGRSNGGGMQPLP